MVSRNNLNIPAYKIRHSPVFWLSENTRFCNGCNQEVDKVLELWVRFARKNANKEEDKPLKRYLCMKCAEEMLEETLIKVKSIKKLGVRGFKMLEDM